MVSPKAGSLKIILPSKNRGRCGSQGRTRHGTQLDERPLQPPPRKTRLVPPISTTGSVILHCYIHHTNHYTIPIHSHPSRTTPAVTWQRFYFHCFFCIVIYLLLRNRFSKVKCCCCSRTTRIFPLCFCRKTQFSPSDLLVLFSHKLLAIIPTYHLDRILITFNTTGIIIHYRFPQRISDLQNYRECSKKIASCFSSFCKKTYPVIRKYTKKD